MVYLLLIVICLSFGILLHRMARHRGCNAILWGGLGASLWFLPIPFLLMVKCRTPDEPTGAG